MLMDGDESWYWLIEDIECVQLGRVDGLGLWQADG